MIGIAADRHLAIIPLLAVALASVMAAALVLHLAALRFLRLRLYSSAAILGVLCALASAVFWSSRHAGTGTQSDWGWPRVVYGRWVSWEVAQREEGVRWRGIVENTVFYGAIATLAGSLVLAARHRSARRPPMLARRDRGDAT